MNSGDELLLNKEEQRLRQKNNIMFMRYFVKDTKNVCTTTVLRSCTLICLNVPVKTKTVHFTVKYTALWAVGELNWSSVLNSVDLE